MKIHKSVNLKLRIKLRKIHSWYYQMFGYEVTEILKMSKKIRKRNGNTN